MATIARRGCILSYFSRSERELENLPTAARARAGTQSGGMGASDWAGMGLQLYGASMQDKAAEEDLKRQIEREQQELLLRGRDFRQNAAESERGAQQTDRSMNITGANMLADQRTRAMQNGKQYSFRNSFLKAMGA